MSGRSLTLSYVKPGGLRQAVYNEFEGLGCGVQGAGQLLYTACLNFVLHTVFQGCTPNLVHTPTHKRQKSGQDMCRNLSLEIKPQTYLTS